MSIGLAVLCILLARERTGMRARLLVVAAVAFVLGPAGGIFAIATDATYEGVICGSALSASLERPREGYVLDRYQEGCRRHGEAVVRGAATWAGAGTGIAVLALLGATLPPRRPAAVPA